MIRNATARAAVPTVWPESALTFAHYHGPDRRPVQLLGQPEGAADVEPFHGIASRGVAGDEELAANWARYAHRLFDGEPNHEPGFRDLRAAAQRLHILSFRQSAQVAERYLLGRLPHSGRRFCELWNIKEGHTSSVWHVTAHDEDSVETFVLNIARDDEAGAELTRTAKTMAAIGERHPCLNMARLEDCAEIKIDYFGKPLGVTVTRNEFIRNALEIHVGRHRQTGEPTIVVVERFITEPSRPSEIAHLFGRVMTSAECVQLEADVASFLDLAGELGPIAVDVNHGDLVWDGKRAVVVAIR